MGGFKYRELIYEFTQLFCQAQGVTQVHFLSEVELL